MNRFTLLALGLIAMMVVTSCGDQDFADPNNPDVNSEFLTVGPLALGMEAVMRQNLNTYLRVTGTIGREVYFFQGADPRFTGELLEGPIDAGGFLLTRPWEARYRCIRDGNILLSKLGEMGLSANEQSAAAGFAKTIQAYQFLLNLTYTWDNGLITDVANEPGPFVDRASSLAFISNLLDEAANDLSNGGNAFPWTLSAGFAAFDTPASFVQFNRALKARAAAYSEDWNGVLSALDGSFLDSSASMDLGAYHVFSLAAGDAVNPIWEDQDASLLVLHGHPSIETDAEAGDQRFARKINVRAVPDVFDALISNLGVITASGPEAPFPIIRNEELVLLRAEANINLGNLSAAETDINLVRQVSGGLGGVTLSDVDSAIDQMLHERRYSLYHEGHRWVDMRRYGKLGELPIDRGVGDAGEGRGPDIVIPMMPRPSDETQ